MKFIVAESDMQHGNSQVDKDYGSVIECLEKERVVRFSLLDNGNVRAVDGCDLWFQVELTPGQVLALANELKQLIEEK